MKIVTLFIAYVAFLNFAKVGAMNPDGRARRSGRGRRHRHNHVTGIINPMNGQPCDRIIITRVVLGTLELRQSLDGELLPDLNITACNGPFGYAVVDIYDSGLQYACLHPPHIPNISRYREHTGGVPEFYVYVTRDNMTPNSFTGVLTTGNARRTFNTVIGTSSVENRSRLGHVRYIKYDPINPINADGYIYASFIP